MTELQVIQWFRAAVKHANPPPECRAWLVKRQQAATRLLFHYLGRDPGGRMLWRVGDPDAPIVFAAKLDGVQWLHLLAKQKCVRVIDIADVPTARAAARGKLERAILELHEHCTALADELGNFTIEAGYARYRRNGPHIDVG